MTMVSNICMHIPFANLTEAKWEEGPRIAPLPTSADLQSGRDTVLHFIRLHFGHVHNGKFHRRHMSFGSEGVSAVDPLVIGQALHSILEGISVKVAILLEGVRK